MDIGEKELVILEWVEMEWIMTNG